jgi:hypothetical protein
MNGRSAAYVKAEPAFLEPPFGARFLRPLSPPVVLADLGRSLPRLAGDLTP